MARTVTLRLTIQQARVVSDAIDALLLDEEDALATVAERRAARAVQEKLRQCRLYTQSPVAPAE